jgi:hypothetical protein
MQRRRFREIALALAPGGAKTRALKHAATAMIVIAIAGCGPRTPYDRYVPSSSVAREALDEALSAWKKGDPVATLRLKSQDVAIEVSDSQRSAGRRLDDYEIQGEVAAEGPRSFAVRLVLEEPKQEQLVRYYLVGIDPLWVFQQRDYDLIAHWEACDDESADGRRSATAGLAK